MLRVHISTIYESANSIVIQIFTLLSLFIHDNNRPLPGFEPQTGHWSEYQADSIPMCFGSFFLISLIHHKIPYSGRENNKSGSVPGKFKTAKFK